MIQELFTENTTAGLMMPNNSNADVQRYLAERNRSLAEKDLKNKKDFDAIILTTVNLLPSIPPGGFKLKGIVTAQVIKSTGFMLGGVVDGIGAALDFSNTRKTDQGLEEIIVALKKKAMSLGANAIIGIDISIADTGGLKSVLMCVQGTAVKIKHPDQYVDLDDGAADADDELNEEVRFDQEASPTLVKATKMDVFDASYYSDGKVVLNHSSGLTKIFDSEADAKKYLGLK